MAVEKQIERELPITLNPVQVAEASSKMAKKELVLRDIEQQKRDANGGFNGQIKTLKKDIKTLAEEVDTGNRVAMVPCMEITNWPMSVTVVRLDRNEGDPDYIVETKPCEVQADLGDVAARKKAEGEAPTQKEIDFAAGAANAADGAGASEPPDEDATADGEEDEDENDGPGDGEAAEAPAAADSAPDAAATPAPAKPRRRNLAANAH